MSYVLVNEKTVNGRLYRCYRDSENPKLVTLECDGLILPLREGQKLRDLWNDNEALEALWQ